MKKPLLVLACLIFGIIMWACERPKSPDFQVNHELQVPLTVQKTYPFLGDSDALIDSTSEDFADLITAAGDGPVQLSKQQEFDFGDLNDAIPEIDVPTTTVDPQVGEIRLTNFSSGSGNVGSAGFQEVIGVSPPSQGTFVPGGSTPGEHNISFNTDFFQSAVIKENGSLELTLTNNLGLDLDNLTITLKSDNEDVGTSTESNFADDETRTTTIDIPSGVSATNPLENLNADISASWSGQSKKEGDEFLVNSAAGQNLVASQVTAAIEPQDFNTSGSSTVDNNNFEFRESDDEIVLSDSTQNVNDLTIDIDNNIDIGIQSLDITFPEIKDSQGNDFEINLTNIPADGSISNTYDISEHSITSETITYSVNAQTENTQQSSDVRTINESDQLIADVSLSNLDLGRVNGYIVPRKVLLNEDVTNDARENLDVFNDDEAEITNIDGLSDISDRVSDITFENPTFITSYLTNLGVNTTIYAAIVGTDSDGNTVYLTGQDNSQYDVTSSEIPDGLEADGLPLNEDQVIKFSIETADNPNPDQGEEGENIFSSSNTNSSEFFSNLPTEIRFVGIARVNNDQTDGEVVNPVIFDPTLNFDLPFNFSANNASFKDTVDADLADLPGEGDKQEINKAILTLNYTNGLPLDLDLSVAMLDANGNEVFRKSDISVGAASTNSQGFVSEDGANQSEVEISFSDDERQNLNRVRSLALDILINTTQQQAVKIRASDSISFQIQMEAGVTSTVN